MGKQKRRLTGSGPAMVPGLPDEIWLLILSSFSNTELIQLLCISRQVCRVSLEVLLHQCLLDSRWMTTRADVDLSQLNTRSENDAGHFTLSASMHPIIPYLQNVRKVTVLIYDTEEGEEARELCEALHRRYFARVPELGIRYFNHPLSAHLIRSNSPGLYRPDLYFYLQPRLSDVSHGNYLILRDGHFQVSVPRKAPRRMKGQDHRGVPTVYPENRLLHKLLRQICRPKDFFQGRFSFISPLLYPLFIAITIILTPFLISLEIVDLISSYRRGRLSQHWRVADDLRLSSYRLTELGIIDLPFRSRISKFILVDYQTLRQLRFGFLPHLSQNQIFLVLDSVNLPQLEEISLGDNQNIDLRFFIPFIQKHTISRLSFGLQSVSETSVSQFSIFPANVIANLVSLSGPPAYIHALASCEATFENLETLSIHCGTEQLQRFSRIAGRFERAHFHDLSETLAFISRLPIDRIPALKAIEFILAYSQTLDWLMLQEDDDEFEAGVLGNINRVILCLEPDGSALGAGLKLLKRNVGHLMGRFPNLHCLQISTREAWITLQQRDELFREIGVPGLEITYR
ncbi:hypothetical protein C8J56DRAFT_1160043 [Mycena floridula]|nr:hypothetical protein C8J56DRAFT_1160043 [Mycena floridula]